MTTFSIDSWTDIAAIIAIVTIIIGVLTWALKLDVRTAELCRRLGRLEGKVFNGDD